MLARNSLFAWLEILRRLALARANSSCARKFTGYVAESPNTAYALAVDDLRLGMTFEYPSVLELQDIVTFGLAIGVEIAHFAKKCLPVFYLRRHE